MGRSDATVSMVALAANWPYRVLGVLVIAAVAMTWQISAIQKQASTQAEQRFWFKVGDEMAEGRFQAFKKNRQAAELVTTLATIGVVLALVWRMAASG